MSMLNNHVSRDEQRHYAQQTLAHSHAAHHSHGPPRYDDTFTKPPAVRALPAALQPLSSLSPWQQSTGCFKGVLLIDDTGIASNKEDIQHTPSDDDHKKTKRPEVKWRLTSKPGDIPLRMEIIYKDPKYKTTTTYAATIKLGEMSHKVKDFQEIARYVSNIVHTMRITMIRLKQQPDFESMHFSPAKGVLVTLTDAAEPQPLNAAYPLKEGLLVKLREQDLYPSEASVGAELFFDLRMIELITQRNGVPSLKNTAKQYADRDRDRDKKTTNQQLNWLEALLDNTNGWSEQQKAKGCGDPSCTDAHHEHHGHAH